MTLLILTGVQYARYQKVYTSMKYVWEVILDLSISWLKKVFLFLNHISQNHEQFPISAAVQANRRNLFDLLLNLEIDINANNPFEWIQLSVMLQRFLTTTASMLSWTKE